MTRSKIGDRAAVVVQADGVARELLDEDALVASSVVANCAMNRERQLAGVNSYTRELGFNPFEWLRNHYVGDKLVVIAWAAAALTTGRRARVAFVCAGRARR